MQDRSVDDVFAQLERVAKRINNEAPHSMIDPVEFGEIKGAVAALQAQVTDIKVRLAQSDAKLDLVLDKLSEAKGGWRAMMFVGGAFTSLGAGATWIVDHFTRGAP